MQQPRPIILAIVLLAGFVGLRFLSQQATNDSDAQVAGGSQVDSADITPRGSTVPRKQFNANFRTPLTGTVPLDSAMIPPSEVFDSLNAAGLPDAQIAAAMEEELHQRWRNGVIAIRRNSVPQEYWKAGLTDQFWSVFESQVSREALALKASLDGLPVKVALNIAEADLIRPNDAVRQRLYYLPEETAEAVAAIQERFSLEASARLDKSSLGREPTPEDLLWYYAAYDRHQAEILSQLDVNQAEEFYLRSSNAAIWMKTNLAGFGLSESEYRSILNIASGFESDLNQWLVAVSGGALQERITLATEAILPEVEKLIGGARFQAALDERTAAVLRWEFGP